MSGPAPMQAIPTLFLLIRLATLALVLALVIAAARAAWTAYKKRRRP